MSSVVLGRRPPVLPADSYNRIQRRGVNYEKRVVRDLVLGYPDAFILHGQWLYKDRNFCQPDIILIPRRGPLLILEVKLSRKKGVEAKLRDLYIPWVESAFPGKPVACGQIYRNLNGGNPHSCDLQFLGTLTPNQYGEVLWR